MRKLPCIFIGLLMVCNSYSSEGGGKKIVIAHRGASGYLPEHSMSAKAMAYAMGADYIEQDVVMTKDDRLVVLHDYYLDRITNVADVYPDRHRKDDRFYAIDFTLEEIQQLEMTEGFRIKDGKREQIYKSRFPMWKSSFRVHTFEDEIELIQGLNQSTGKKVGIYPEIKDPWFHAQEGKDISRAVLTVLKKYGYTQKSTLVYLQCFDPYEVKRIHDKLFPEFGMEVKQLVLIGGGKGRKTTVLQNGKVIHRTLDWIFEPDGMQKIAEFAEGIGPGYSKLVKNESTKGHLIITDMVKNAHAAGLVVHPFTFRVDARLPDYVGSFEEMLDVFYYEVGVDGVFTDFPDRVVDFLKSTSDRTEAN